MRKLSFSVRPCEISGKYMNFRLKCQSCGCITVQMPLEIIGYLHSARKFQALRLKDNIFSSMTKSFFDFLDVLKSPDQHLSVGSKIIPIGSQKVQNRKR